MFKKNLVIGFIFLLVFTASVNALSLGVVDGYVTYINGSFVEGAAVNAQVISCSTECTGSYTSESSGYYVIGNLNFQSGRTVSVNAQKGSALGSNSAVCIDDSTPLEVNITICSPPSSPSLTPINDHHNQTTIFSWTSGTDPDSLPTIDQFQLDSGPITNETSPLTKNLSFSSHSWQVRTCKKDYSWCCSDWSSDSFNLFNNAPSPPNLTDMLHTTATSLIFQWASGTDPDNDSVYDEFQLTNTSNYSHLIANNSNASSPFQVSSLKSFTYYLWKVRTCDQYGACSNWSEDAFFIYPYSPSFVENIIKRYVGGGSLVEVPVEVLEKINVTCQPKWVCTNWTKCSPQGIQWRNCTDLTGCYQHFPDNATILQQAGKCLLPQKAMPAPLPPQNLKWLWFSFLAFILVASLLYFYYQKTKKSLPINTLNLTIQRRKIKINTYAETDCFHRMKIKEETKSSLNKKYRLPRKIV